VGFDVETGKIYYLARLVPKEPVSIICTKRILMLNVIVCIKVVSDPEAPASTFRIDPERLRAIPGQGVPPVMNPYDENSLEAALRIKGKQDCKITVISAGKTLPKAVIKKSMALGADELVVIEDEILDEADGITTAAVLAAAIKKLGMPDLILTGRIAADTNAGQVGPVIAELLGIPCISVARKIEVNDGRTMVERVLADGYEVVEGPLPCLITISHELGELRQATVKGLMAAQKRPFTTWKTSDINAELPPVQMSKTLRLFIPERKVECEIVGGETPEEAGSNLALKMIQTKTDSRS
jgi:electron transfer flavoprotein beta subunit